MKKRAALSVIMILTAASGWGVIGLFSRPLSAAGLRPLQITFVRSALTVTGMGLWLLLRDRALLRVSLRDGWMFLGTGLISILFFNICYFTTIQLTTLATASILLYTAPFFVMLLSAALFHEPITAKKLAALALAFGGCVLVSGLGTGSVAPVAILTGVGAGAGYASYSIFAKLALKKYHTFTLVFYTFAVSTVCLAPFARISAGLACLAGSGKSVLCALGLGLISTFMPYILYTRGLENVAAGKASVLAFAEPMVATLTGILAFHEPLHPLNAAGIGLIFAAIVLLNLREKK